MLGQRIVTAVVLLALLLPALFAPVAWPFQLFTLALVVAAGWEWGRLNAASFGLSLAFGAVLAVAGVAAVALGWAAQAPGPAWWLAALGWVAGGAFALRRGPVAWPRLPAPGRWALGLVLLWTAWLAIAQARTLGLNFLLSIFVLVWVADIAAYAGGRAFGRRKLAPTISPGKSWEGVASGMVGVCLLALAWTAADRAWDLGGPSLFTRLVEALGWVGAVIAWVGLTGMSVVGDLAESLVKRACGAKDSSRLLPGHGGVLDRVDALLPVFPLAVALASL
jgi:phosphatidate cytidylyltransferase